MMNAALLLLADGRFPSGGHAHSGGLEAAVAAGSVTDLVSLKSFLIGRLATTGPVTTAFAAAGHAATDVARLGELEAELDARIASRALRLASRKQGRALIRAGRAAWPSPVFDSLGPLPHHAIALGVTAAAASLSTMEAALVAAYGVVNGPASAAVRLLGLDPYQVQRLLAELAPRCDEIAATARPDYLPAHSAPLADISAEIHATWEVRLFAS